MKRLYTQEVGTAVPDLVSSNELGAVAAGGSRVKRRRRRYLYETFKVGCGRRGRDATLPTGGLSTRIGKCSGQPACGERCGLFDEQNKSQLQACSRPSLL